VFLTETKNIIVLESII